ncbi:hypothetical protein N752_23065 [Desulforamulus aquiferis]|nr:hypothetical protein [Desulforamulus aquiferis]RYD02895.1 hypothetical protein N752_23065 [Desulforamulus aquiferis]
MIMDSKGLCHPWWVFPTALAFGFGIAVIMGAPIGRQVNRLFRFANSNQENRIKG